MYLPQRWVYTKAKEQSSPSFGEVWIESEMFSSASSLWDEQEDHVSS